MWIDVPAAWEQIDVTGLGGVLMVVGGVDTGKSTLARYLFGRLATAGRRVAYLDGDPGQSTLGPPATLTAVLNRPGETEFPPRGPRRRWFVGHVTPRGHMLPLVVGTRRLADAAQAAGAEVVLVDTSGLVAPEQGGLALKLAKLDLLRPTAVFTLAHARELEPLLEPLRRLAHVRLWELRPSPAVQPRTLEARRAYRQARFEAYFAAARPLVVSWRRYAVWPAPHFTPHTLVALEDAQGFTLALGLVVAVDLAARTVTLHTPLADLTAVAALRVGDTAVRLGKA